MQANELVSRTTRHRYAGLAVPVHATVSVRTSKPFERLLSSIGPSARVERARSMTGLLSRYGLTASVLTDDEARLPHALSTEALLRSAHIFGSESVAVRAACAWRLGDHGIGDYLNASCSSVRHFLDTIVVHVGLLHTGLRFRVHDHGDETALELDAAPGVALHPLVAEGTLVKVALEVRHALGRGALGGPLTMQLRHGAPTHAKEIAAAAGVPVEFGHDRDGLSFHTSLLDTPFPTADPVLHDILRRQAQQMLEGPERPPSLLERVRAQIELDLREGSFDQCKVARNVGMSVATLRRRLDAEHGVRFVDVANAIRRDTAARLLARPTLSIDDVGALTGFSQTTAFYRACKRWFRQTPAQFRRAHADRA